MEQPTSPIRPTDDQARTVAHSILAAVRYGALATIETATDAPMATKIAIGYAPDEGLFGYMSDLAQHTPEPARKRERIPVAGNGGG